ncbi:hypothetical protein AB7942_08125 [Neobacillus sp. BF23-41]|uniref:hypothetical protein n=1 Tax=Neobacillus sp. BF23-41 TaxID=3240280 RepID=UPI0034E4D953
MPYDGSGRKIYLSSINIRKCSVTPEKVRSNPFVWENAGKVALKRGPIVYCLEEIDNGKLLSSISIPREAKPEVSPNGFMEDGLNVITIEGDRVVEESWKGGIYSSEEPVRKKVSIQAVPYYYWGNGCLD